MKPFFLLGIVLSGWSCGVLSAAPEPVRVSTDPSTVAITGETMAAPPPAAITDSDDAGGVFVTLTRTAMPKSELPSNTDVITSRQLRQMHAATAGDAVETLTSVQINRQGQLGSLELASLRGANSEQTLVLIDGRPIGGVGLSASQDLSEIPVEQIDRIEVVRGGVSALYGPNGIGGVINVITKRSAYTGLPVSHVGFEGRSFGGQRFSLDAGSRYGPVDFFFFGHRSQEQGFRDNQDADTRNIGGNVGLAMGKAGKLLLDVASYHAEQGLPGQLGGMGGPPDVPVSEYDGQAERIAATPNARQQTDTFYGRGSYLVPLPMDSLLTLRAWQSGRAVDSNFPDDPLYPSRSERRERSTGGESQLQLPLGFLVGGSWIRDRLDNRDLITPANSFIAHVENWGIFAQETLSYRGYALIPSLRYDHNSQAGDSTSPRVQAIAPLTPWLKLSGSAARSVRAPTLDDLFYPYTDFGFGFSYQGNPDLRSEKAWTYDAGFELRRGSSSLQAMYFRANVSDLIQTTAGMASTKVNIGSARRQGAELQFRNVWTSWWSDEFNYTYLENRGMPQGYSREVYLRLSPRHSVNYRASFQLKRLTMDHRLRYVGASYEDNDLQGEKIADRFTWDIRLGYPIRQLDLYVGLNDVLDKRYRERAGYPLPGRTVYGGVTLRLWG